MYCVGTLVSFSIDTVTGVSHDQKFYQTCDSKFYIIFWILCGTRQKKIKAIVGVTKLILALLISAISLFLSRNILLKLWILLTTFSFLSTVTVQCTKDGHFIVVVAKDTTLPHLDLNTISMYGEGPTCTYTDSNSEFAIYYFDVTQCGTAAIVRVKFPCFFKQTLFNIKTDTIKKKNKKKINTVRFCNWIFLNLSQETEPGIITYENMMRSYFDVQFGDGGQITRDTSYE